MGQRAFYGHCGSQLWYAPHDGRCITLNPTSFDNPKADALLPRLHVHNQSRLSWFDTTDSLPRYAAGIASDTA